MGAGQAPGKLDGNGAISCILDCLVGSFLLKKNFIP
jgi:hypothetical protein